MGDNEAQSRLEERLKRYLKAELKLAGMTYDKLGEALTLQGFPESKASIASKLGRGSFATTFFIATLRAIGKDEVSVFEIYGAISGHDNSIESSPLEAKKD